jgi:hypothetical protein
MQNNYMFSGLLEETQMAAMFYSFIGIRRKNTLTPFEWLKDALNDTDLQSQ